VVAQEPGTAFLPARSRDLDRIFSIQQERVVNRDNTVQLDQVFQIEKTSWRGDAGRLSRDPVRASGWTTDDSLWSSPGGGLSPQEVVGKESSGALEAKSTRGLSRRVAAVFGANLSRATGSFGQRQRKSETGHFNVLPTPVPDPDSFPTLFDF